MVTTLETYLKVSSPLVANGFPEKISSGSGVNTVTESNTRLQKERIDYLLKINVPATQVTSVNEVL